MGKTIVPMHLIQNLFEFDLDLNHLGVFAMLAKYEGEITFNDFLVIASKQGPEESRLSPFEINSIIKDGEKKSLLKIIKFKSHYKIEWLPKSFG